ncbi:MAG: hypothetical protein ACRC33_11635, partial [Gemmataceae bacterium]
PPPPPRRIGDRPLCPKCHRPGPDHEPECGYCGYLLGDGLARDGRRDALPHRGPLIDRLGAAALVGGAAALVTGPLGLLVALLTGLPAWWMAAEDLPRMRTGEVDPAGRHRTEVGRLTAGLGVGLGFVLGIAWTAYVVIRLG